MSKCFRAGALLALICIAFFPAECSAGLYAYIGLYVDGAHSLDRQDIPYPYFTYTTWVWVLPGDWGLNGASFKLIQPQWNFCVKTTPNPLNRVNFGACHESFGIAFEHCQYDWVWLYQLEMIPVIAGVPGYIEIGAVEVGECWGHIIRPVTILNKLGLNQDALIHTDDASWSAIKNIYSGR